MEDLDILIRTHQTLTPQQVQTLAAMGLGLVSALPDDTYRFRGRSEVRLEDLAALDFVADVDQVRPLFKLDAELQAATFAVHSGRTATRATERTRLLVSLDSQMDAQATLTALANLGQVLESSESRAVVEIRLEQAEQVAALPGVLAAEIEPEYRTQNHVARRLTMAEHIWFDLGLDGSGEIVGVADSGLDSGDVSTILADFQGRVVGIHATVSAKNPDPDYPTTAAGADLNNHGTHVSGTVLGNGANAQGTLRGMAPAAHLSFVAMGFDHTTALQPGSNLTPIFAWTYGDGARIHNNSWGNSSPVTFGRYTFHSEDVDRFVWNQPDMLILFSAGNAGRAGTGTVTPPATAKNCLTIGASESLQALPTSISLDPNLQDNDGNPTTPKENVPLSANIGMQADNSDHIGDFSSRGPTLDQRIKPELVAPGTWILSCRSSVSVADVGPDSRSHRNPGGFDPDVGYWDDADGHKTHAEAVGRGLPGAPFYGTWNQTTPDAPTGSGNGYQQHYFYNSGTSMATPVAAGCVALLRQYLRLHRGVSAPSAALLKALLVNGATVPTGESQAPNNTRGFGRINLDDTIRPQPTGEQLILDDLNLALSQGEVRRFTVDMADAGHPFRVTLTWTDFAQSQLQNLLYLRVRTPAGAILDGDTTPFPFVQNNVQRVHLDNPAPGAYVIEVHGLRVLFGRPALAPQTRQDFALAIRNGVSGSLALLP